MQPANPPVRRLAQLSRHCSAASQSADAVDALRAQYGPGRKDAGLPLGGLSHLALVSSNMQRTVEFYGGPLGLPLPKTIALPDGGQHFFFDVGRGASLAFFWGPRAPRRAPGVASVDPDDVLGGSYVTAHGSMNHAAFNVPPERLFECRRRLRDAGVEVSPVLYHADVEGGFVFDSPTEAAKHPALIFASFYFFGPDGEYLELTSQARQFSPERDIEHVPEGDAVAL